MKEQNCLTFDVAFQILNIVSGEEARHLIISPQVEKETIKIEFIATSTYFNINNIKPICQSRSTLEMRSFKQLP